MTSTTRAIHTTINAFRTRSIARTGCLLGLLAALGTTGCLDRPVGETSPETHNLFVDRVRVNKVDKIDVLFMVDNSLSMADKQQVLAVAVPQLLRRLTSPDCVAADGGKAAPIAMADPETECEAGYKREFSPVRDIHIGVVTSSLGDFGGNMCDPVLKPGNEHTLAFEDKAWLLGSLPRTKDSLSTPFLSWTPDDARNFQDSIGLKEKEFRSFVTATGEYGCGFEMSLESWYRFLIDPEPPQSIERVSEDDPRTTKRSGIDDELIAQRKEFLRPDSLLAIVMLTDENDCSFRDDDGFFLRMKSVLLHGASSVCAENPNDKCCYGCDLGDPPDGCAPDPVCAKTSEPSVTNLRCFDQKRRFGHDFLFPTQRYVNALRLPTICPYQNHGTLDCDCKDGQGNTLPDCNPGTPFKNPLFDPNYANGEATTNGRSGANMVFLAGIVGVPWQDIAEENALEPNAELRYKVSSKIDWDLILPNEDGTMARDPLMHEQLEPRTGIHPITQEPIGLPKAGERQLNSINWHDMSPTKRQADPKFTPKADEPQYACVFDLSQPLSDAPQSGDLEGATRDCAFTCEADDAKCIADLGGCPCKDDDLNREYPSPLCQTKNGEYGNVQYAAKAYPGIRELEVLRGHNLSAVDNSIVASICPKDLDWNHRQSRGYGYNPAVQALVDRLKVGLAATCLPRKLAVEDNKVPCAVVEAIPPNRSEWANCKEKDRDEVEPALANAVRESLKADGLCDTESQPACSKLSLCQLRQLTDDMDARKPLTGCQTQADYETASPVPGFCYVDPAEGLGSESLVEDCPANRRRILRIVGDADMKRAPAPGAWTFIACAGAPNIERAKEKTASSDLESKE